MSPFLAKAFRAFAFGATFFGLLMLVIFFVRLGINVGDWLQSTPRRIEEENARLTAELERIRASMEAEIKRELQKADEDMEIELTGVEDAAKKAEIRQDYEGFKARRRVEAEMTAKEKMHSAEIGIRADTSPGALVGHFLTSGPSDPGNPQNTGIWTALMGSIYLGLITILCAVPVGVGAAVYLEEYKSSGWLTRIIQVNINNLAGVPSVVYGILGGFLFVELIFKHIESEHIAPRNVLGGGLTLVLLTLPIVIVSAQEAIRAVPMSLRHGALALGATRWQVVWHHVLPNASPGILTGTILALARALGEAAPLILFGAQMHISQNPTLFSRFTILPMQIFDWTSLPEDEWRYNAAMASVVLVLTLLALNATAIYLRNRWQRQQS